MDGWLRIGTKIETKEFDSQIEFIESQMEEIEYKLKQADMGFEVGDTVKLEAQYEKLANKLLDLNKRKEEFNKNDLKEFESQLDNVEAKTGKVIKKMGKWALAIVGIRSAYMGIRKAMDLVTRYNEQIRTDLEYMGYAIATALEPVVKYIVNLLYQLLGLINNIAISWFNVNLFANASAKAFKKANASANALKKTMAGFDEMNTLQSANNSSTVGTPSFSLNNAIDTSGIYEIIDKIQNIFNVSFDKIRKNVEKALIDLGFSKKYIEYWNMMVDSIKLIFNGLFDSVDGLLTMIIGLLSGDAEKVKEGAIELLDGLSEIIRGFFMFAISNFLQIRNIGIEVMRDIINYVVSKFPGLKDSITRPFITAKDVIVGVFSGLKTTLKGITQVITGLFTGDLTMALNGFKNTYQGIMNSLWSIAKVPLNLIIGGLNKIIRGLNKISFSLPEWAGGYSFGINIKEIPKLKSGGIINMPGPGVPLGIGGEAGREGVIPLTDSQAMEELGSAIGRYITINLTNNTNLDGRTIARQQSKVQANRNFAMNG